MTSEVSAKLDPTDLLARANEMAKAIGPSNMVALRQRCMAVAQRHHEGARHAKQRDENIRGLTRRLITHALTGEYPDA